MAIGVLPAEPTPDRAAAHDCERRERGARDDIGVHTEARAFALGYEHDDPGPHRIQLPHVTEVAEIREQDRAVCQNPGSGGERERR